MGIDVVVSLLSSLGISGIIMFFIKRYFDRRDAKEAARIKETDDLMREVKVSLETIRLLAYAQMSDEIERLLNQGYATPAERRFLQEMYANYKAHGWNGDMDARLKKVNALRTDRPTDDE